MNKEIKPKKGKTLGIIVGAIAFILAYFGTKQLFKTDLESNLQKAARELNEQTPVQMDQYTRLDSASAKGTTNFIYYYSLIDIEKSEVNLDTVNKYIRSGIIENVKTSPELKVYRDHNITMDYIYYDKNGDLVTKISVTPELYAE